jgi:penicillin V acylase-like amidase (Ntn superfamily)
VCATKESGTMKRRLLLSIVAFIVLTAFISANAQEIPDEVMQKIQESGGGDGGQSLVHSGGIDTTIPLTGSYACTSFCLATEGDCTFGVNLDRSSDEGLMYVNKRNVSKIGWEKNTVGDSARWTSAYGSVTFNIMGYNLPYAGMNEAGLMISTLGLNESRAPAPDDRFPLLSPLWVQYQLDNYSTVDEVIASDSQVRITMNAPMNPPPPVDHFLVCDKRGECATIEFLDGKMVYHTGNTLPVAVLTNALYEESVKAWQDGKLTDDPDGSLIRFGTTADRVTGVQALHHDRAVEYAFETLQYVSHPFLTVWSLVFDPENLRAHFRTKRSHELRYVDLSTLDFSCRTPVKMVDINEKLSGDIRNHLMPYSHDASLDHLAKALANLGMNTPRDDLETGLREQENFQCREK